MEPLVSRFATSLLYEINQGVKNLPIKVGKKILSKKIHTYTQQTLLNSTIKIKHNSTDMALKSICTHFANRNSIVINQHKIDDDKAIEEQNQPMDSFQEKLLNNDFTKEVFTYGV